MLSNLSDISLFVLLSKTGKRKQNTNMSTLKANYGISALQLNANKQVSS